MYVRNRLSEAGSATCGRTKLKCELEYEGGGRDAVLARSRRKSFLVLVEVVIGMKVT